MKRTIEVIVSQKGRHSNRRRGFQGSRLRKGNSLPGGGAGRDYKPGEEARVSLPHFLAQSATDRQLTLADSSNTRLAQADNQPFAPGLIAGACHEPNGYADRGFYGDSTMINMNELTKARRRIRSLERCLCDVSRLLFERAVDLNAAGRDKRENPEFQVLRAAIARINRTLG